jgi:hypothetical protein
VLAEGVEKISLVPVKFQGAVGAAVEIAVRHTVETDYEGGSLLAAAENRKTKSTPAFRQIVAATDD